ncbi:hypothetical protein RISK_000596 [Rhodopirellula islandica]|uniref:Uncharacterized protein n=1 Tax=Rhodopirellula islandica TaxID=595434 RepID=A0A0J1BM32_RHOIS|nr:hypothetical protein RISK_000596 [Rhodopirellula islandica]
MIGKVSLVMASVHSKRVIENQRNAPASMLVGFSLCLL